MATKNDFLFPDVDCEISTNRVVLGYCQVCWNFSYFLKFGTVSEQNLIIRRKSE